MGQRHLGPMETLLILCVFVVAGAVKGLSGLGLPTVGIALMGVFVVPVEAAALVVVPAFLTNVWQALRGGALVLLLRRLWPLLAGIVIGTAGGGLWRPDPHLAQLVLAEALMLYAMLGLLEVTMVLPPRLEAWLAAPVGGMTGVLTALTGVFVLPSVPYLQALRLPPAQMVQALGICFTLSSASLAVMLGGQGDMTSSHFVLSLAATVPALGGMVLGARFRQRVPPLVFRRVLFVFLFAIGVHLLLK
ncbi:MAG: sulfite exporter TauE/SafE family protein [Magnetospirillum gryphiswaldense]|nr:sulfite exporter TauE/SafE family protein [Magnetospirillum gryphiswaldense]